MAVTSVTLAMDPIPAVLRRPRGGWLEFHYLGMCWSRRRAGAVDAVGGRVPAPSAVRFPLRRGDATDGRPMRARVARA